MWAAEERFVMGVVAIKSVRVMNPKLQTCCAV